MDNKKQNDYLRLYFPKSNFFNAKIKFNSYSNDKKNIRNKINNNFWNNENNQKYIYLNIINNNKESDFYGFEKKYDVLREEHKI